jgi:hypothetical protein
VRIALVSFTCLVAVPVATGLAKDIAVPSRLRSSADAEAFEYCERHPGKVYFPWQPLAAYLAERRVYHFELGIEDRIAAGVRIDQRNFDVYVPAAMQFVAYKGTPAPSAFQLLKIQGNAVPNRELPGWLVFPVSPRVEK